VKDDSAIRFGVVLPLPRFVLHPIMAVAVATVHVYLAADHLSPLFGGDVQWTHFWKGFGALGGAYVFAALASRGPARHEGLHLVREMLKNDGVHISPPTGN